MLRDISHGKRAGSGAHAAAVTPVAVTPVAGPAARRWQAVFTGPRRERLRRLAYEFVKFGVIGGTGVFITNAVYDLFNFHLGTGPVTSATIATAVAAVFTYLGNRYWSFRTRKRTGVVREVVIFAVLNGFGLLIQDATVAFNTYLLHLEHHKVAAFVALNTGIALATLFRFWSYRRFVWLAPSAAQDSRPRTADPSTADPRTADPRTADQSRRR